MYPAKAIMILLWVFFGFFSSPADAQVNLKTGYNIAYVNAPDLNEIIKSYDEEKNYENGLGKVTLLHGFQAGLRFKTGMHAIEAGYMGSYSVLKGSYMDAGQEFIDRLSLSLHTASVGYQASDRAFGAGTDLHYTFYKIKFREDQTGSVFRNIQNSFALKFYLMINLRGDKGVDMSIQPYYILPFTKYDLAPLAEHLQQELPDAENRWYRIGLSLLFYNGKKYD
jgi:hypothetical protein